MIDVIRFVVALGLGVIGIFFLVIAVRAFVAQSPEYRRNCRLSGGVTHVARGDPQVDSYLGDPLFTEGLALGKQPDGSVRWEAQRKLSRSALRQWGKRI